MASIAIFEKKPKLWRNGIAVGLPIVLDASLREDHGVESQMTTDVIESDANVTDHIVTAPLRLTIEFIVSRHPTDIIPNLDYSRHINIYRQVEQLFLSRQPFDIVTSMKSYTNMFGSLRTSRSKGTTNIMIATMDLRKVQFSSIDVSQLVADQAHDIALAAQNLGSQAIEAVPA